MRVTYTVGPTTIAAEVKDPSEAHNFLCDVADIFGEKCGCCGSADIVPAIFRGGERPMRKMRCRSATCGATIMLFGREDGGLYYVRQNRDKSKLPNNGWSIYKKAESGQRAYQSQAEDRHPSDRPAANTTGMSQSDGGEVPF